MKGKVFWIARDTSRDRIVMDTKKLQYDAKLGFYGGRMNTRIYFDMLGFVGKLIKNGEQKRVKLVEVK